MGLRAITLSDPGLSIPPVRDRAFHPLPPAHSPVILIPVAASRRRKIPVSSLNLPASQRTLLILQVWVSCRWLRARRRRFAERSLLYPMKHHTRRSLVSTDSALYPALRWAYQPVKAARQILQQRRWRPRIRRIVNDYLADDGFKGLHVGCGPFHLDGWLNTELFGYHGKADFPQDITRRFPFPDHSLDAIYASEVIEHISRADAMRFLGEAGRVLRRGGVLRITTPDVTEVCRLFLGQRHDVDLDQFASVWLDGEFSREIWINSQFNAYGHKHLWSLEELSSAMRQAGFDNAVRCRPMQTASTIPQLQGLETRYGAEAPAWLFARTLIVEAEKTVRAPMTKPLTRSFGRRQPAQWDSAAEGVDHKVPEKSAAPE